MNGLLFFMFEVIERCLLSSRSATIREVGIALARGSR